MQPLLLANATLGGHMISERKIIHVENSSPLISKKKKKKAYITAGVLGAIIVLVIAAVLIMSSQDVVTIGDYTVAKVVSGSLTTSTEASGTVVLPTQVSIVSMEEGYANEVYVNEGDTITDLTILAVLDVPDLEESRDDLVTDLEAERIGLEEIELNQVYALKEMETDLSRLNNDIIEAELDVEAENELLELKSSRVSEYETAVEALETLQEDKEDLLLDIEKQNGTVELSIRKQIAFINQLQVSLDRVKQDIFDSQITSPISGDILSLNEDLTVPGSLIEEIDESVLAIQDKTDSGKINMSKLF